MPSTPSTLEAVRKTTESGHPLKMGGRGSGWSRKAETTAEKRDWTPQVSSKDIIKLAQEKGVKLVDYRFTDLLGTQQHLTVHIDQLEMSTFERGVGFDGSSIRGFQAIHESDMLLMPDAATAFVDPMLKTPTLALLCDIADPITKEPYRRDARGVAKRAEKYLRESKIATHSLWGPEAEFFVFDSVRFDVGTQGSFYAVDSDEGIWNSGKDGGVPNLAYRPRHKEGYFPLPPTDSLMELRSEIMLRARHAGVGTYLHHHEVATAGQCEIAVGAKTLISAADQLMVFKYVVRNVAREHGKVATFMPKPLFGDNGNGMHCHQSLWKDEANLMAGKEYAGLSRLALWYIGGLLKHAPALCALCSPTTNSYKRLVPGYEAPVNLAYSSRNRSAAVRIPTYWNSDPAKEAQTKRLEYRPPDPTANPYLAFSALMMAGLDGIINKIEPGKPVEKDIFELHGEELARIPKVPGSLEEALNALEKDHEFLLRGGVFTKDILETWIEYKRKKEVDFVRMRPHPAEFHLYLDA